MALRDNTRQRFKDFFEKHSKRSDGKEFELSYSEIQRDTGAANSTMKRAIESLVAEGRLEVKPGRNSRYGVFKLPAGKLMEPEPSQGLNDEPQGLDLPESAPNEKDAMSKLLELEHLIDGLRRRIRTQEMTIALLQDRLAEIEDKLYRK